MNRICRVLCFLFLLGGPAALLCALQAPANQPMASSQASTPTQAAHKIPVMDGAAGPCSLELTVTTADGSPAYAVNVNVHIAYGFEGIRKLDLEAGTNVDGNVKFVGLPSRVHRQPLEFKAANDRFVGIVIYDPEEECHAKHDLVLDNPKPR